MTEPVVVELHLTSPDVTLVQNALAALYGDGNSDAVLAFYAKHPVLLHTQPTPGKNQ